MKKLLLFVIPLLLLSCSTENELATAESKAETKNVMPVAVLNFKTAINEINKPIYSPTKEHLEKHGYQLSDERKEILFEPAKDLITSTGISEKELQAETNGDRDKILIKAFKIYVSLNSKK